MLRTLLLLVLAGCPTLPTAAELTEPEMLAIIADPPCAPPNGSATLALVVAGPDGLITPDSIAWSVVGVAPSSLSTTDDRTTLAIDAAAAVGSQLEVDVDARLRATTLHGVRSIVVGEGCANPTVSAIVIGGAAQAPGTTVTLAAGSVVALDVDVAGGVVPGSIVSWFTTAGSIDLYRQTPTTMIVGPARGGAMLYVVYRDGVGGVAWSVLPVQITEGGTMSRLVGVTGLGSHAR